MEYNSTGRVRFISHDRFTVEVLSPVLKPALERCHDEVVIYIFSEKNINQFLISFRELFIGGRAIILVDGKFKHFLNSILLRVTSEIFSLNKPMDKLVHSISHSLESKKMLYPRGFNDYVFNIIGMIYHLNERENDVLTMVLEGQTQTEIARKLSLTQKKVSNCKISAMSKMGMKTLVEVQTSLKVYTTVFQRQGDYLFKQQP
jgi:DNA-binding NarL/FixJ family response regulator